MPVVLSPQNSPVNVCMVPTRAWWPFFFPPHFPHGAAISLRNVILVSFYICHNDSYSPCAYRRCIFHPLSRTFLTTLLLLTTDHGAKQQPVTCCSEACRNCWVCQGDAIAMDGEGGTWARWRAKLLRSSAAEAGREPHPWASHGRLRRRGE